MDSARRPNGSKPAPPLPEMSVAERKLWAASHRLPENMFLVSFSEMEGIRRMGAASSAMLTQLLAWKSLGKLTGAGDDPMLAAERIEALAKRVDEKGALTYTLKNGSIVTGARAVELLESELARVEALQREVFELRSRFTHEGDV